MGPYVRCVADVRGRGNSVRQSELGVELNPDVLDRYSVDEWKEARAELKGSG